MTRPPDPASPALGPALARARAAAQEGILGPGALARADRQRLAKAGLLEPIMRGWHRLRDPQPGAIDPPRPLLLRRFLAAYLRRRYGDRWCLSALSSLQLALQPGRAPARVVVLAAAGATTVQPLPGLATLTVYPDPRGLPRAWDVRDGVHLMRCDEALARVPAAAWAGRRELLRLAVGAVQDWGAVTACLPPARRRATARRLLLAVDEVGERAARASCRRALGPVAGARRLGPAPPAPPPTRRRTGLPDPLQPLGPQDLPALWASWRRSLIMSFPVDPAPRPALVPHLGRIADALTDDVRHSLRLSGFPATRDLVSACRAARPQPQAPDLWPPADPAATVAAVPADAHLPGEVDPLLLIAVQGQLAAVEKVKETILSLLQGASLAQVLPPATAAWYRALMRPWTQAGLLPIAQLRRYRRAADPVLGLGRAPCEPRAIRPAMDVLYQLICAEPIPGPRAVLGKLGLLAVQPWSQGNGRMARLLMNALLASGGLPWLTVPGRRRRAYAAAVHQALAAGTAAPLARLLLRS